MYKLAPQVEPIIRQAGQILLGYFRRPIEITTKDKFGSLVTEADLASEKYLIHELGKLMPEAAFFAEESGKNGKSNAEFRWVIDPLDGTTNFARGLDYFSISIALTQHDIPQFGMIYRPVTDELFWASQGAGAFLNGAPISVSKVSQVADSVVVAALPYGRDEGFEECMSIWNRVAEQSLGIRKFGSAALDAAQLACGRVDGVFHEQLGWWDIAAAMVIVTEAGGLVSTYQGGILDPLYTTFLAANPSIYTPLQEIILKSNRS
jgi:myo-inositol-1(or 4)-monophosphatase